MLNTLGMAQETVDQIFPRLGDLLQINGVKSTIVDISEAPHILLFVFSLSMLSNVLQHVGV